LLVFQVFTTFEKLGISVDVLATSEVSISLTLDPSKLWSRELIQQELDKMKTELQSIGAVVNLVKRRSIISLICNVKRSSLILEKVFEVFNKNNVNVQMISQGASKVCVTFINSATLLSCK
jgi:aspartate kinase